MLTYLKPGDRFQHYDILIAGRDIINGRDVECVLVVGETAAASRPGHFVTPLHVDALRPRRWTPDREYQPGWAHEPGALD